MEGLKGGVADDLPCAGQFRKTDDGRKGGAFDQLHQKSRGWGGRDARGLWQNDLLHTRDIVIRQGICRFGLSRRYRLNTAAPDFAQKRAGMQGQRDCRRQPCAGGQAHNVQTKVNQEQLHQQRGALKQPNESGGH